MLEYQDIEQIKQNPLFLVIRDKIQKYDLTPWKKKVKYLGIYITLLLTNFGLKQANLEPLRNQLGHQLEKW